MQSVMTLRPSRGLYLQGQATRQGAWVAVTISQDEFVRHTERFRRELLAHCYRMLGSLSEAEDMSVVGWRMRFMSFTGWPEEAFDVLEQLEGDPPLSVRQSVRKDRERLVRRPMVELVQAVADIDDAYGDHLVTHYGKTAWWWQHQCALIRIDRCVEVSVRFDLDGLYVQGAWWYADPGQKERFREAVADESAGPELAEIVETLQGKGYEIDGDVMKRVPRGYSPDHPRALLLRHRSLLAKHPLGCDPWLHTPEAVERVHAAFEELRPFLSWLADHTSLDAEP